MLQTTWFKDTMLFAYRLHRKCDQKLHRAFQRGYSESLRSLQTHLLCASIGQIWSNVPKSLKTKLMTLEPLFRRDEALMISSGDSWHHFPQEFLRRHATAKRKALGGEEHVSKEKYWLPRIGSFQRISIEHAHCASHEDKNIWKKWKNRNSMQKKRKIIKKN